MGKVVNKVWSFNSSYMVHERPGGFSMKANTCLSHERMKEYEQSYVSRTVKGLMSPLLKIF